jgi:Rrf2 family protein
MNNITTMFNKETEYALRALVYIRVQNMKGRMPGIAEIAKESGTPHFYIAKILQRLVKSGLLRSIKGKGGGFYFDENGHDTSLLELVIATEGQTSVATCGFGLKTCDSENPCPMHERYAPIRDALNNLLSGETITSLAEKIYGREAKAAAAKGVK